MGKVPTKSRFLERKNYRQRRLRDVAKVLPVIGGILWTIPLMWRSDPEANIGNATALLYIFGVWIFVIVLTGVISRLLEPGHDDDGTQGQ